MNYPIEDLSLCTGCTACYSKCPRHCIHMEPDRCGFLIPAIDEEKCIKCGACSRICPQNKDTVYHPAPQVYAYISGHEETLRSSTSGGAFYTIAESVIRQGGIVYGAAFTNEMECAHIEVTTIEGLRALQGSKYVQSNVAGVFEKTESALKVGKQVLFCGTACQVDGLKNYLGREYENLVTLDLLCKGVPSPGAFREYLKYLNNRFGERITGYHFRDKYYGWGHFCSVELSSKNAVGLAFSEGDFIRSCGKGYVREACFHCKYTRQERVGDITLGDFWRLGEKTPFEGNASQGASLVLINSPKGEEIFRALDGSGWYPRSMEEVLRGQSSALSHPMKCPDDRDDFFNAVFTEGWKEAADRFLADKTIKGRLRAWKHGLIMFKKGIKRRI